MYEDLYDYNLGTKTFIIAFPDSFGSLSDLILCFQGWASILIQDQSFIMNTKWYVMVQHHRFGSGSGFILLLIQ